MTMMTVMLSVVVVMVLVVRMIAIRRQPALDRDCEGSLSSHGGGAVRVRVRVVAHACFTTTTT